MPPLRFPFFLVRAISERWMPANTPIVPAMMKTPTMRMSVPRIWSRRPPPSGVSVVQSTSQRQWARALVSTPMSSQVAGAMMRTSAT